MSVNGVPYPFERIRVTVPAGILLTFTDISYDGEKPGEVQTNADSTPRGETSGPWQGTWSANMGLWEFDRLNQALEETGILGAKPMPVTVLYGAEGAEPIKDELEIKINKFSQPIKKGNGEIMREISGNQTKIPKLNGIEAYKPPQQNE